jgi:hypothetical protein
MMKKWYTLLSGMMILLMIFACLSCKKKGEEEELVQSEIAMKMERYSPTKIDFDDSILSEKDRMLVKKLVEASKIMDEIFLRQCYSKNLEIREMLRNSASPKDKELLHYFTINFGPFDRLDERAPFMGEDIRPKGANYYPEDLTIEAFENWLKEHPEDEESFQGLFAVIRREGDQLVAVPYSQKYKELLEPAADLLKEAAELTDNPSLKKYLVSRADAFLSDDYYQSDIDWMDLKGNLVEITIGPYEVYEDNLFGYKAAFESFVTINDPDESKKLEELVKYLPEFEMNLPIPDEFKNLERGAESPIRVAIEIYTAGDTKAGVQTTAFNLPNDERVRKAKGSKKVMLKNVGQAKFNKSLVPISKVILEQDQQPHINFNAYFNEILQHEMAHGIGPGFITLPDGTKTEVGKALKEHYSAMEEAKADIVGLYDTQYLIDKGVFPKEFEKETYSTFVAGIFRSIRFGIDAAHGRANIMELNFVMEKGGILYDPEHERFRADFEKVKEAIREMAHEILMIQAKGDHEGAGQFIEKYAHMPPEVEEALKKLEDVPVDIEPLYTIEEKMANW